MDRTGFPPRLRLQSAACFGGLTEPAGACGERRSAALGDSAPYSRCCASLACRPAALALAPCSSSLRLAQPWRRCQGAGTHRAVSPLALSPFLSLLISLQLSDSALHRCSRCLQNQEMIAITRLAAVQLSSGPSRDTTCCNSTTPQTDSLTCSHLTVCH